MASLQQGAHTQRSFLWILSASISKTLGGNGQIRPSANCALWRPLQPSDVRRRDPVYWTTPVGDSVLVDLSVKFGTFFGYSKPTEADEETADVGSQSYLGTQCHGVMWPAEADLPHGWPVAPPIIAGKVRCWDRLQRR